MKIKNGDFILYTSDWDNKTTCIGVLAPYIDVEKDDFVIFKSSVGWGVFRVDDIAHEGKFLELRYASNLEVYANDMCGMIINSNMFAASEYEARRIRAGEIICPVQREKDRKRRGVQTKFRYLPK